MLIHRTKERNIIISNEIAQKLALKLRDVEYCYGKGIGKADNYCQFDDWLIVFEIECSQRHPEFNVSKVWPYLEVNEHYKIFLIQYITNTKGVSPNRINHCNWLATKMINEMNGRFDYYLICNEITDKDISVIKNKLQLIKT